MNYRFRPISIDNMDSIDEKDILSLFHVDISEEQAWDSEVGGESDAEDCIPGLKVMNTPSTRSSNVSLSPKNCDEVKGLLSFGLDPMMTAVPSSSGLRFVRKRGQINHKISDESDSSGPGDDTDDDPSYSPNLTDDVRKKRKKRFPLLYFSDESDSSDLELENKCVNKENHSDGDMYDKGVHNEEELGKRDKVEGGNYEEGTHNEELVEGDQFGEEQSHRMQDHVEREVYTDVSERKGNTDHAEYGSHRHNNNKYVDGNIKTKGKQAAKRKQDVPKITQKME
ncbi:hypothetical protein J6590_084366 [Homalodisca vitripennis]|nr:hypothetical protein J6590_084366 [Homalodisca vitripennis]